MFVGFELGIIFFCGAGIGLLCWLILGRCHSPVGKVNPVWGIVVATGNGEGVEGEVGGFLWLTRHGWYCGQIIIAHRDLTEEGRRCMETLVEKYPNMTLCPLDILCPYLAEIE